MTGTDLTRVFPYSSQDHEMMVIPAVDSLTRLLKRQKNEQVPDNLHVSTFKCNISLVIVAKKEKKNKTDSTHRLVLVLWKYIFRR